MTTPYHIIEIANSHGGSFEYLEELVNSFTDLQGNFGVKFQAFHPDKISTPDFSAYKIYQELHFTNTQWADIIKKTAATKDVWLDIFDEYGVQVLKEQINLVHGIKFQSSVLYNYEVFNALSLSDLTDKKIILNVAAQPVEDVKKIIERVEAELKPKEILLEFGYQAYPTSFEDSGLSKVETLRKHFSNKLVFADHVDGKLDDAIWLPVAAAVSGVEYIEKHVMLSTRETKYDHFSSLTPDRYKRMVEEVKKYTALFQMPFINAKEKKYLENTLMIPLLNKNKAKGKGVSLKKDAMFRRSGTAGLNVKQIENLQNEWHILARDKQQGETLQKEDFKKATVATIIACRLKSSRLEKKALLKIGNLASVEYCIASALKFENINHTILATSVLEQDAELKDYTYNDSVIFHKGDPDDVIRRYLDIAEQLKVDVIVRVTADNPFIDNEVCQILLKEHFASGADYTVAKHAAVGTNLEIMNVQALQKIKQHFTTANYSEYMTWYFQNNPEHFHLHFVDLPNELVRDYRMTLDHQEDLDMFNAIHKNFTDKGITNFSLRDIYSFLDAAPEVAAINSQISVRYKTDADLIATLNRETKIK